MNKLEEIDEVDFYQPNLKTIKSILHESLKELHQLAFQNSLTLDIPKKKFELHTQGFDDEQIWNQLQITLQPRKKIISKNLENLRDIENLVSEKVSGDAEKNDISINDEDENEDNGSSDEEMRDSLFSNNLGQNEEDDEDDEDEDLDAALDKYIRREQLNNSGEKYTDRLGENVDGDEDANEEEEDINNLLYQDDPNTTELTREEEKGLIGDENLVVPSDADDDDEEEEMMEQEESQGNLTKFQKHQNALIDYLDENESDLMKEKDWQETGEVSSRKRPMDSLLGEHLSFQHASKDKPLITEELNETIEEIIINRIVTGIFNDPEKPTKNKKKLDSEIKLKEEKSKKSLAEIYEDEYMKRVEGIDTKAEEEKPHIKAQKRKTKESVRELMNILNALSNLNYVPSELVISSDDEPEEEEEEPEQIKKSNTLKVGETEETKKDKAKKRRKIKKMKKNKAEKANKLIEELNPGISLSEKDKELLNQTIEKKSKKRQHKKRNGLVEDDDREINYSKSKLFFQQIQDNLQKFQKK